MDRRKMTARKVRAKADRTDGYGGFRSIVEKSADGVFTVGADGLVRFANDAGLSLLRRSTEDVVVQGKCQG